MKEPARVSAKFDASVSLAFWVTTKKPSPLIARSESMPVVRGVPSTEISDRLAARTPAVPAASFPEEGAVVTIWAKVRR